MNETELENIAQYLNNEMSPQERTEFELQIANDESLRSRWPRSLSRSR